MTDIQDLSGSNRPAMARPIAMCGLGEQSVFILLADGELIERKWDYTDRIWIWERHGNVTDACKRGDDDAT